MRLYTPPGLVNWPHTCILRTSVSECLWWSMRRRAACRPVKEAKVSDKVRLTLPAAKGHTRAQTWPFRSRGGQGARGAEAVGVGRGPEGQRQ